MIRGIAKLVVSKSWAGERKIQGKRLAQAERQRQGLREVLGEAGTRGATGGTVKRLQFEPDGAFWL